MSNEKMGGPAFPSEQTETHNGEWNQTYSSGMALWDYYAAAALTGAMSYCSTDDVQSLAEYVADAADAMLAERAKRMEAES